MSDFHASPSFRRNAPRGTRHSRGSAWECVKKADLRVLAVLIEEGKAGKQTVNRLRRLKGVSAKMRKVELDKIIAGSIKGARNDHPGMSDGEIISSISKRISGEIWSKFSVQILDAPEPGPEGEGRGVGREADKQIIAELEEQLKAAIRTGNALSKIASERGDGRGPLREAVEAYINAREAKIRANVSGHGYAQAKADSLAAYETMRALLQPALSGERSDRKAVPANSFDLMRKEAEENGMVYCHPCSEAGGADMPIYHKPPACPAWEAERGAGT